MRKILMLLFHMHRAGNAEPLTPPAPERNARSAAALRRKMQGHITRIHPGMRAAQKAACPDGA